MNYVLGGGVSGLLWAYYHRDYTVVTDQLGRAVTGADPVIWLNDTDLTRRLMKDLGEPYEPVTKEIGYLGTYLGGVKSWAALEGYSGFSPITARRTLDNILVKKMFPWEVLDAAYQAGIDPVVRTPSRQLTKDAGFISYLDCSLSSVCLKLYEEVSGAGRFVEDRVSEIAGDANGLDLVGQLSDYRCEHLVSTVPAPVFGRLWRGRDWSLPRLSWVPVTFVVSEVGPPWWDDRFAMVYDADLRSPVSRVGRFGDTWRWEFTGRPHDDDLNEYMPVQQGRFVNPYGRIVQDLSLHAPTYVTFLGRAAEWDYKGLIDVTLERVHGRR